MGCLEDFGEIAVEDGVEFVPAFIDSVVADNIN